MGRTGHRTSARKIEQYNLDKVVHYGRIWRLIHDGVESRQDGAADEQRERRRSS